MIHRFAKGVQDADHHHPIRAAVQRRIDRRGNLMSTIQHAGMGKDDNAAGAQSRRQIPFSGLIQLAVGASFAQFGMFAGVKGVDLLAEADMLDNQVIF